MKKYHAHIYFTLQEEQLAEEVASTLLALNLKNVGRFKRYDKKVGPHYLPMIEMHFTEQNFDEVTKALKLNHNGLSVLIHQDSGDDFKDHEACLWIGPPLPIDFDFFHKVQMDLSLSIH